MAASRRAATHVGHNAHSPLPLLTIAGAAVLLLLFLPGALSIPIDNSLVGSQIIKECLSGRRVDLAFILDGSGSIGDDTFELQKAFVNTVIERMDIGDNATRVGIVQFAEQPRLEISLAAHSDKKQLQTAIEGLGYLSGATSTGAALQFTLDSLFAEARGGDIPKVAVVITDGQSQDDVSRPAQHLKDAQVLPYAIGVTDLVNVNELYQITGNAARVFTVDTFDKLDESLSAAITLEMCKTEFRPGTPEIICGSDRVGVRASTKRPFEGYVFVKDHFHQPGCRLGAEAFGDPQSIHLSIPFGECDVKRYRSLNPRGIYVETTIIFMFHTSFMTKVDQAVKVQCFYMEADKTVETPLEVSMLTTGFQQKTYPMPTCFYSLRLGAPDGPVVKYATIGESVYHRWECVESEASYDTFGMVVHSCFVDDGTGDHVELLDGNGCGLDVHLMGTPDYEANLRVATREYHVFKYADKPVTQFQCQITVCIKYDGGCEGITPPSCAAGHSRRRREALIGLEESTLDVLSEPVIVFNPDTSSPTSPNNDGHYWVNGRLSSQGAKCVTHETFVLVVAAITAAYLAFGVVVVTLFFRRKHSVVYVSR
uniref:Uncharacterized protein n=1 Tax=Plectus sambesii TaxID=2011161 RepID=A0A914UKK0_9BILA